MMCRAHWVWLAVVIGSCVGCLHDQPTRTSSWFDRIRTMGPSGPDAVYFEYVLVERPAGNIAMNRTIWADMDEQILPSETRTIVNNNGFRVGTIAGILPSELEALYSNPRSAEGHRLRRVSAGTPAGFLVNGPVQQTEYQVRLNSDSVPTTVNREQVQFSLMITPQILSDGRLQLKCVPEVEYYDKKYWTPLGAVGPGWGGQKPTERYASLGFEMTVSAKELIVIGSTVDKTKTLGNCSFIAQDGNEYLQRILILRAGRVQPDSILPDFMAKTPTDAVPLAAQASQGVGRNAKSP